MSPFEATYRLSLVLIVFNESRNAKPAVNVCAWLYIHTLVKEYFCHPQFLVQPIYLGKLYFSMYIRGTTVLLVCC